MSPSTPTIRILAIRAWTELASLRSALRDAGYSVRITCVDIEPALNAALQRGSFDVIVYDPSTPAIARETLAARMRDHARNIPVIELTTLDTIAHEIARALAARMN